MICCLKTVDFHGFPMSILVITPISISMFVRHIPDSWLVIYISLVHLQPLSNQQKSTQFLLVKLCSTVQYIFLCCSKPFLKSGKMRETSPAEAAEPAVRSLVMRPLTKKRERSRDPAFSRCVVRCVVRLWLTSRFVWSYQQLISL